MNEFITGLTVVLCGLFYWLGGQEVPWTRRGYKWIRRFVLPVVLCVALIYLGAAWHKALAACSGLCVALHVGYQTHLWKYAITGAFMGACALIVSPQIDLRWLITLLPAVFHTGFGLLSLKDNKFGWAIVAVLMGVSIGTVYLYLGGQ